MFSYIVNTVGHLENNAILEKMYLHGYFFKFFTKPEWAMAAFIKGIS